uniref:Uncharacterized protein n=1 Tax=Trichogramma kaykai TaxID=54128 RepID=A0ABD2WGF5_9HYME
MEICRLAPLQGYIVADMTQSLAKFPPRVRSSSRVSRIYCCVPYNSFFVRDRKRKGSTFFAYDIRFAIRKCVSCIVARGRKCFQEIRGDPRTSSLRRT